jgi:adenine deaminase
MTREERTGLMNTALGRSPADVVLRGGHLVNVYSGEVLAHMWVATKGERIAYVGPAKDSLIGQKTEVRHVDGRFILPGFIDAHTHLDSIFQVGAYAQYAMAFGNTTAVSEVAMTANAMGVKGVEYFLEETRSLPFRVFFLAPPGVPPFPEVETTRPFTESFFQKLLGTGNCLGIGESYWPRVTDFEQRAMTQYEASEKAGKTREGHAAGARGSRLVAYAAAGTTSCHESVSTEEAVEKLRLGMAVMIREGYVRRELEAVSGIAGKGLDLRSVMMVTDMADPEELVKEGGMNLLLRKAVALGFGPVNAVQMVTVNAARYFGLNDLGGVAPGKLADMAIVSDLKDFNCEQVWLGGRLAAEQGRLLTPWVPYAYPEGSRKSVTLDRIHPDIFSIPFSGDKAKVRVEELVNDTISREIFVEMKAERGKLAADTARDILKAAVFNKTRPHAPPGLGFTKNAGLRTGAIATSLVWDTNNILTVGVTDSEMASAVNALIELKGGFVVVQGGKVMAQLPLPICGIISAKPLPEIVKGIKEVQEACHQLGSRLPRPFLTFQTFPFTGLPFLRLTDQGLVDVRKMTKVPLLA